MSTEWNAVRSDGGRHKNHPPLNEHDPETQEIQEELEHRLKTLMRHWFLDSPDERERKQIEVFQAWRRRYPEISEGRRGTAFERFMSQKRIGGK